MHAFHFLPFLVKLVWDFSYQLGLLLFFTRTLTKSANILKMEELAKLLTFLRLCLIFNFVFDSRLPELALK